MAPNKIIIDTDPGVDDILAMLLAFSAQPEELEILLLSVTYGNVDVRSCLQNVVSLFYHIEREMAFRESRNQRSGFETLRKTKPIVAIGPEHPLADTMLMADFFHGVDGLGGIYSSHPHLSPTDTWEELFSPADESGSPAANVVAKEMAKTNTAFVSSRLPGHKEMLRVLREHEPDTITIVALGPLTNLAIAAAEDPETFLRVKEVVVMGGTIDQTGNISRSLLGIINIRDQITPVAEFNTFADSLAAARVYALTSPNPHTTMPSVLHAVHRQQAPDSLLPSLPPYPEKLSRQLKVSLFPLDITERHLLTRGEFRRTIEPLLASRSPLAEWTSAFLTATFDKVESLQKNVRGDAVGLQLHDPLCIWYCLTGATDPAWTFTADEDIRVETAGQWTRGMCVVDRRTRRKRADGDVGERPGDSGNWLSGAAGNRLARCVASPGETVFGTFLLRRVFGL